MKRFLTGLAALAMILTASAAFAADVSVHQWARPDSSGQVTGRVIVPRDFGITAVRNADVSLVDENGNPAAELVKSDNTGRFVLTNVQPGAYTLMIRGDDAIACCALHIVAQNVPIDNTFEIAAGAIDFATVKQTLLRYASPFSGPSPVVFDPTVNPWETDRASINESLRLVQTDGGFEGRITKAGFSEEMGAALANVIVYQNGVEVARTTTDETGNFRVNDLPTGSYSVIGIGRDGFGLMGLDLINPLAIESVQTSANSDQALVAMQNDFGDSFVMQVAPPGGAFSAINEENAPSDTSAIPLDATPGNVVDSGYGMMNSGGGGGGGGGAMGGGGGRGLGAIGAIGVGIAILLDNDDDVIVTPGPVSPVSP